jgi:hypothetical protein
MPQKKNYLSNWYIWLERYISLNKTMLLN